MVERTLTPIIDKATSATYKPVTDDVDGDFLTATAMYTDGEDEGKTAMGVSANEVDRGHQEQAARLR